MCYFSGTVTGSSEAATFSKPAITLKLTLFRNKYFFSSAKCLRTTKFLDNHYFCDHLPLHNKYFFIKAAALEKLLVSNSSETWQSPAET